MAVETVDGSGTATDTRTHRPSADRRATASVIARLNRFLAGWAGYFRHGNSARSFDKLQAHAKLRVAIFLGVKHQRGRWWGQRTLYSHPTELGIYRLVGTVKAPRPHQWRHQPRRAG